MAGRVAATRFLGLVGLAQWRGTGLRWDEVDLDRRTATLADTKTGRSIRPLSRRACDVLRGLPHVGDRVFPATRGEGRMSGSRNYGRASRSWASYRPT